MNSGLPLIQANRTGGGDRPNGPGETEPGKGHCPVRYSVPVPSPFAAHDISRAIGIGWRRSGLGRASELCAAGITVRRDCPQIGMNLQDHLLSAGNIYRANHRAPPSGTQHLESLTYIHAKGQRRSEAPELVVGCVTTPILSNALADRISPPLDHGEAYTLMFGITHPRSRGRLRLVSASPEDKPEIDPVYLSDETDRAHFSEAPDWARTLGHTDVHASSRNTELLPETADLASDDARMALIEAVACTAAPDGPRRPCYRTLRPTSRSPLIICLGWEPWSENRAVT